MTKRMNSPFLLSKKKGNASCFLPSVLDKYPSENLLSMTAGTKKKAKYLFWKYYVFPSKSITSNILNYPKDSDK